MYNFDYYNPVTVLFGKGKIADLCNHIPQNVKIMITYGGGSIKKNGVYEQVMNALKGYNVVEFGGIEPNPHYETLIKAVELIKKEKVEFVLAVGGGSVIDGTKFIVAASCFEGADKWDILSKHAPVTKALPFASVLTLPATGSEMNCGAVITRAETHEKFAFSSAEVFPRFSVLDPETTYTLPRRQVANGIIDTFVHVMEQYLTYPCNALIQDRFAEGILQTLLEIGPKVYNAEHIDYDDRANFMWAATMGLNGLIACGVVEDWSTHNIGHELTALHGLDHAVTLAIVLPGVLNTVKELRKEKLLQYGERIWNINPTDEDAAGKAIAKTEEFFNSLGVKTRLSDYHIGENTIHEIVARFKRRGTKYISGVKDVHIDNLESVLVSRL